MTSGETVRLDGTVVDGLGNFKGIDQPAAAAEMEKVIDRRVQARLATDPAYRNAENAEEQSAREDEITAQVCRELGVGDG